MHAFDILKQECVLQNPSVKVSATAFTNHRDSFRVASANSQKAQLTKIKYTDSSSHHDHISIAQTHGRGPYACTPSQ
jgi:hypothetical protein